MKYSTDEPRWVALKLKLGFVQVMKDIFVSPNCLKPMLAVGFRVNLFSLSKEHILQLCSHIFL
jgi:hypothetical protein